MATWFLINNIQVGTDRLIAGSLIDDAQEDATAIRNAGGLLVTSSNAPVAAAAALAQAAKLRGDDPAACAAIMQAGLETSQEQEVTTPVTNATALAAITAANRSNGMEAVKLDDYTTWVFASGSGEAASDWCIVPAAGTGRWLRSDQTRGAIHAAVANNAALIALTATQRQDGSFVEQLDTMQAWSYDLGSAEAASAWCVVPTDAVGRWLLVEQSSVKKLHAPVADAAAVTAITAANLQPGMAVCKLDDNTMWTYSATSAEAVSSTCLAATGGVGRWLYTGPRWGTPMQNRLCLLGAPGKAVQGNTVVIGGDTYEFRDDTPPTGGTAGHICVYNGVDSAESRANLIASINHVINAAVTAYPAGGVTENFLALAGVTVGNVAIVSANMPGGTRSPSATATACSETLATAADIWDNATCRMGVLPTPPHSEAIGGIAVTAPDIAKGTLEFHFTFAPRIAFLFNRNRVNVEAYVVVGNSVSLTLAGGGAPNTQPADVLDVLAFS